MYAMSTVTNQHAPTGSTAARNAGGAAAPPALRDALAAVASLAAPRLPGTAETVAVASRHGEAGRASRRRTYVDRGLTTVAAPLALKDRIQFRALEAVNRFGVIRTFDVAACCFPERPFKAALTAAQRAMRGLVKAELLKRFRTDRQQHVYGLTRAGATFLEDRGVPARTTVHRVADMTNPEHLLWSSFIVTCCEVRGLRAQTESELLRDLARRHGPDGEQMRGLLQVPVKKGAKTLARALRPDALAFEGDGMTWFEIDRSRRGDERAKSLEALFARVGAKLNNGQSLKRVVVLTKSERILASDLATAEALVKDPKELRFASSGGVALKRVQDGVYEVWGEHSITHGDGRSSMAPALRGHVVIQMLPLNLPKFRLDERNAASTAGWFPDNYLPYVRPASLGPWPMPTSPLL